MPYAWAEDGCRLHYETIGRPGAPTVLMIQGLGADKHGWDLQRYVFALRYRVVAFDNRGAGRSDKPFAEYSLEQMADDAVAVLDAAGVEKAHVIGVSMGGAISQIVAVRHPDRVFSLTLACTACRNFAWRRELLNGWATMAAEQGIGKMAGQAARWVIGPRSFRRLAPALGWLGPIGMTRTSHGFVAQVRAILSIDESISDEVSSIDVPTLVIVGNQDILTPRGDSEELADRIPKAELVVVSGAAHGIMVEHASTFNRIVLDFLKRAQREVEESAAGSERASA
jgi:3-oxoadipate enol-lactonase